MFVDVRRIYYDKTTGNKLVEVGYQGFVITPSTIEKDISDYPILSERNRDSFDVLELSFEDYSHDFAECNGYRVNVDTKELEFSCPDPNEPDAPQVFVKPLTVQIEEIKEVLDFVLMGGM